MCEALIWGQLEFLGLKIDGKYAVIFLSTLLCPCCKTGSKSKTDKRTRKVIE